LEVCKRTKAEGIVLRCEEGRTLDLKADSLVLGQTEHGSSVAAVDVVIFVHRGDGDHELIHEVSTHAKGALVFTSASATIVVTYLPLVLTSATSTPFSVPIRGVQLDASIHMKYLPP
jgi:hypothetical protein